MTFIAPEWLVYLVVGGIGLAYLMLALLIGLTVFITFKELLSK